MPCGIGVGTEREAGRGTTSRSRCKQAWLWPRRKAGVHMYELSGRGAAHSTCGALAGIRTQ